MNLHGRWGRDYIAIPSFPVLGILAGHACPTRAATSEQAEASQKLIDIVRTFLK
jgi:hypothetical protein